MREAERERERVCVRRESFVKKEISVAQSNQLNIFKIVGPIFHS